MLTVRLRGRHAHTSRRRGPHYGGRVTKSPTTATPIGTGDHASSRFRRVLHVVWLMLLAANLRPARAPDPTAVRTGKVDPQLYTSAIWFLYDRVYLRSSVRPDYTIVYGRTQAKGGNKWKGRNGQR
jgi:hypothetical protein